MKPVLICLSTKQCSDMKAVRNHYTEEFKNLMHWLSCHSQSKDHNNKLQPNSSFWVNEKLEGREAKYVGFTKNVSLDVQSRADQISRLIYWKWSCDNDLSPSSSVTYRYKASKWKTDFPIPCTSLEARAAVWGLQHSPFLAHLQDKHNLASNAAPFQLLVKTPVSLRD